MLKKIRRSAAALFAAVCGAMLTLAAGAAPFTPGNVVVYRVGDGAAGLVNTGAAVYLDEYTPTGTLVQSLAMPTTASGTNNILIASGTATSEGQLSLSSDGRFLLLTGYNRALGGSGSISGTTAATVARTVGRVDLLGNIDTSTALTDAADKDNIRSAFSTNGTDLYVGGGAGGVRYATLGGTTSIDLSTAANLKNTKQVGVFAGQLYASSGSGTNTFKGINAIGTGLPTTAGQAVTRFAGLTDATNPSPEAFFLADLDATVAGPDTLYIADDSAGLQKFSLVGGSWTLNGTVGSGADTYQGLTATVAGTNVLLYATRKGGGGATGGGELVSLLDATGYNGAFAGTPTLLATAAANESFRGVALTPVAAPEPASLGLLAIGAGVLLKRSRRGRSA